jgi:hypothetical protein
MRNKFGGIIISNKKRDVGIGIYLFLIIIGY